MTPPINIGGDTVDAITIDGTDVSEVTVDGSTVFSTIPDSEADDKLVHRWVLTDESGSLGVADSVGGADGTNNGVTLVTGDYAADAAGDGDGSSAYIETSTLGTFGSDMDNGFAAAFSFQTTDVGIPIGQRNSGDSTRMQLKAGSPFDNFPDDNLGFVISDDVGNLEQVYNNTTVTDGNLYRGVVNVNSPTASDINFWINQTDDGSNTERSNGYQSATGFDEFLALFARNREGTIDNYTNIIMDDICLFGEPLTSTEIQSYSNPWE